MHTSSEGRKRSAPLKVSLCPSNREAELGRVLSRRQPLAGAHSERICLAERHYTRHFVAYVRRVLRHLPRCEFSRSRRSVIVYGRTRNTVLTTAVVGNGPQYRESSDCDRLSPITTTLSGGTTRFGWLSPRLGGHES